MNLGRNKSGVIYLSNETRKANLAIFGIKNTGKAYTLMPYLIDQDLKDKNTGVTIVVDTPGLSWYLYAMAKINNRKVDILKPSINIDVLNNLLFKNEWDYDEIKKIYDYEKVIKEKRIVIIDMEAERYGEKATRAVTMLLLQLQSDMIKERKSNIKHAVYIDNATDYISYIRNLLKYGEYYNFSTTLILKARCELKENAILLDNYVRNYMLLQGINYDDAEYFGRRMALGVSAKESTQSLLERRYKEFAYEIISPTEFKRVVDLGELVELDEAYKKDIQEKATYWRKRAKTITNDDQHLQLEAERQAIKVEGKNTTYLESIEEKVNKEPKRKEPQLNQMLEQKPVEVKQRDLSKIKDLEYEMPKSNEEVVIDETLPEVEFSDDLPDFEEQDLNMSEPEMPELSEDPVVDEDFSDLDIDLDEIPEEEMLKIDLDSEEPEKEPIIFDEDEKISLPKGSNVNLPYQKIKNKKIASKLNRFKL